MTKNLRDDRSRYVSVECFDEAKQVWYPHSWRVTPRIAALTVTNLEAFGHKARIVPNVHYRGVFGPTTERE